MSSRSVTARIAALLAMAMGLTAAVACDQGGSQAKRCSDIPAHGCPLLENDEECVDPTCAAAYACIDGAWSLAHACAGYDAGPRPDAAADTGADAASSGLQLCDASEIDAPPGANGGASCIDPQAPDCWVGQVLACGSCLGCETLFTCQNGEQVLWGSCTPDGGIVPAN